MEAATEFRALFETLTDLEREALADSAETSIAYLKQVASGHRKAGASLIARLKQADSRITDQMMRPDLYGKAA